jgi:hypothetical protein
LAVRRAVLTWAAVAAQGLGLVALASWRLAVLGLAGAGGIAAVGAGLALAWVLALALVLAAQGFELLTQAVDAVQGGFGLICLLTLTAGDEGLLGLVDLIAQMLQVGGDLRLGAVAGGIDAGAEPVSGALQMRFEIGLVGAFEGAAQLVGRRALAGVELAGGVAHVLFERRQIIGQPLAIGGQLLHVAFGGLRRLRVAAGGVGAILHPLHAIGLIVLLVHESIRFPRDRSETRGGLLRLQAAQQIARLAEPIRRPPRLGRPLRIRRRPAHVVLRLPQPIQRLFRRLLRRPRPRIGRATRRARFTRLVTLPGLPGLTELPPLARARRLPTLSALSRAAGLCRVIGLTELPAPTCTRRLARLPGLSLALAGLSRLIAAGLSGLARLARLPGLA